MVISVVAFVLIMVLATLFSPILLVLGIVWICRGGRYRSDRDRQSQEAALMQKIHQGLGTMERRIEALETILLDKARQDEPFESARSR